MEQPTIAFSGSYRVFIGVDISKSWIDVVISVPSSSILLHRQFKNKPGGFKQLWKWLTKYITQPISAWLFCMEATGLYTRPLVHYLMAKSLAVWIASGLEIKRSSGLIRGKNDQVDAHRIARYAAQNSDLAQLVQLSDLSLEKLQDLQASRQRLIKAKNILMVPIKELKQIDPKQGAVLERTNRQAIKGIEASLKSVEAKIDQVLKEDIELTKKFDLACSVKGVGKVLAVQLLLTTKGFTRMMNGRKLACQAGVAPFEHQSGSSIKSKNRVSNYANKQLKKMLHMAALAAIRCDEELQAYYQRQLQKGKPKMSVINAVRNKVLHRVIAVVQRGYPYIDFSTAKN